MAKVNAVGGRRKMYRAMILSDIQASRLDQDALGARSVYLLLGAQTAVGLEEEHDSPLRRSWCAGSDRESRSYDRR